MLRTKFRVGTIIPQGESELTHLYAVYSSDPEDPNHTWSFATPSGTIALTISNPSALGFFKQGQEYFVDFTPAEAGE